MKPSVKKIFIRNSKKQLLSGYLHTSSSHTLCIICHGFGGSKDDFVISQLAKQLSQQGIDTYRFDFTGNGESEGSKEPDLAQEVQDVHSVIDFFAPAYKNIYVIGGSLGGLVSAIAAIQDVRIKKLILINPFLYLAGQVSWNYKKYLILLLIASLWNTKARNTVRFYLQEFRPKKIMQPTLIIAGVHDRIVSYKQSVRFYAELQSEKKLLQHDSIDHALTKQKYVDYAVSSIVNWL